MEDHIIRCTAGGGSVRAFAVYSRAIAEEARIRHGQSPVITAALGRLMSGAVMMGSMMKGDKDLLTIQVKGDGPAGGLVVTADSKGNVKGYCNDPMVMLPPSPRGKLDVGRAVGKGHLRVISDIGLSDPYVGEVELACGEIAEDLAYYYAASEQIPSGVGLGVLMNKDNTVRHAGGFIIQLLPGAGEDVLNTLEERLNSIEPVTTLLDRDMSPTDILEEILKGMDVTIGSSMPCRFKCDCSKEKMENAIRSLPAADLAEMRSSNEPIEVKCAFCGTVHRFMIPVEN